MTDTSPTPATEHVTVTVTLAREDRERLVRLANSVAHVSEQSAEDAEDYDPDEGPDVDWITSRHERADDARAFVAHLRVSVTTGQ
ncbi:hypothetical protein [Curtobacterium sp. MCBD17_003]|uniref:hypothetical protein n=1 Tax=Curtobacterium sp. MCBD17_003 TaxID=2175667 RepID=UPI000DA735D9|nr:hypothetical protein [Curtobacterium sp. MCBD17_003]WIE56313.1 hypothetical protein DEI88_016355 [Curtobacterium sp. MCBD17_003]